MSVADLTSAVKGLTRELTDMHKSMGSVTESLPDLQKVGESIKENLLNPMDDLEKLFGSFQQPAKEWIERFREMAKAAQEGTADINVTRDAFGRLLAILLELAKVDRRLGTPEKLNDLTQAFERFLYQLTRMKRRP